MVGIQENEERVIYDPVATGVKLFDRIAGETESEATAFRVIPIVVAPLLAIGTEPSQVFDLRSTNTPARGPISAKGIMNDTLIPVTCAAEAFKLNET